MKITTKTFLCQKLPIIGIFYLKIETTTFFCQKFPIIGTRYILFAEPCEWRMNIKNFSSLKSYIGIFDLTHTHLVTLKLEELWKIVKKRKCSDDTWSVVWFKKTWRICTQKCVKRCTKKLYKHFWKKKFYKKKVY